MSDDNSTNSNIARYLSEICNLAQMNSSVETSTPFREFSDDIYQQLLVLSEQSIFAPSEEIEQFRVEFLSILYRLDFDPLFGGLIVPHDYLKKEPHFEKSLVLNSLIADLLLQADRLLYTGELTQVAKLSIQHLHNQLQTSQDGLIKTQTYFAKKHSENTFQSEQLKSLLDNQELMLLNALISNNDLALENSLNNKEISIFNKRSLLEAANLINMPFKQAQILVHAIQLKLRTKSIERTILNYEINDMISANSLILHTLSNGIFYLGQSHDQPHEQSSWQNNVDGLMNALMLLLDEKQLDTNNKVQVVLAGIYYLQTNFSRVVANKLFTSLRGIGLDALVQKQVKESKLKGKQLVQQLSLIASVISTFNQSNSIDGVEGDLQLSLAGYLDEHWTIVILEKNSVLLDSQLVEIKSEFNPYRLVFCV